MDPLALPDIAGMLLLMGVLEWLRRKHRASNVDLWMLGLLFILLETLAVSVLRGGPNFARTAHTVALDAYVLAAIAFGWAARDDVAADVPWMPLVLPPALPLLAVTTMYGVEVTDSRVYLWFCAATLLFGGIYLTAFAREEWRRRVTMTLLHAAMWGPMIWMAHSGALRLLTYWGLAFLFALLGVSFRQQVRKHRMGGMLLVCGFLVWAICFLAHPFVRERLLANLLVEQVWTMQKFFVIIGMLLVLLEDQTQRLENDAMHDQLTGLPNRRLFNDRLVQALERARRTGKSAAVFVVDLNNFKHINDNHGHRTGDLVLTRAAAELRAKIRGSDTLARCGGDEFSIIVNDLGRPEDCERIAEMLRTAVAAVEVPDPHRFPLSGSIGYAVFPEDVGDVEALCEMADIRMYKDKRLQGVSNSGTLPLLKM